jgi:hypothetical protein
MSDKLLHEGLRNFRSEARHARRDRTAACRHPAWRSAGSGRNEHEVCVRCGDRFPCRTVGCGHFDCADWRREHRSGPAARAWPVAPGIRYLDGQGRVLYDGVGV